MEKVPTKQTIIDHFSNGRKGTGKWLLVSAPNDKFDHRFETLWGAVGHEKAAVLTAVKDWTKKGKMPAVGFIIDSASGLRVLKASRGEGHGSGNRFIAFVVVGGRPATVADTYLDGAVRTPSPTGPRKRVKSFKASEKQEIDNSAIKGVTPVATNDGVSSVERTNALSTR